MNKKFLPLLNGYKTIGNGRCEVTKALQALMFRMSYRRYMRLLRGLAREGFWLP